MLVRKKLRAGLNFITGSKQEFPLEHRIFNISSFIITTFAVMGGTANYAIGLVAPTVWLSFIGAGVSLALYYLARFRRVFNIGLSFTYVAATVIILGIMNFYNGGIDGTVIYLIIMLLNIFLLIVPARYQYAVYGVLYGTVTMLLALEYLFPQWVMPYHSSQEKLVDHVVTMFYSMLYTTIVIVTFRKAYNTEREKVLQQNKQLVELNEYINSQREALEQKTRELENSVKIANAQNEHINILLRELNHRVKNNLQVVSSLLNLQAYAVTDESARNAILASKNRLVSMVLIHQRLYHHENRTQIFMPDYLRELSENIMLTYYGQFDEELIQYNVDPLWLNVEKAIPLGLISNEIITNCFKHTVNTKTGTKICVELKQAESQYMLSISDNGAGFIEAEKPKSFGMQLVKSLVKQLNGTHQTYNNNGAVWHINFN
ncbi:MAG: hypothetical protein LPJ89_09995 [Hymenobacteraceae bacterium]|nr:hypothetical protein [Hymenobacteraceae bacterium]MDX5395104.1 hypothetical protein [Hymenobacteraceae bacterium]MDX5444099.1 hypothetical protein [Hymenobacteraceae bacterium]MDX5511142.1 hypothetical protein [Hymenobacteraceae bacterium]